MSETQEQQASAIPRWTPEFDPSQFDVQAVLREAMAQKKSAYKVLKSAGYPVAKFISNETLSFKQAGDGAEVAHVTLTASSTADDLADDDFAESAIEQMRAQAKGMSVFLNHSYVLPEDLFGTVEEVVVERRKTLNRIGGREEEHLCLDLVIRPVTEEENPRGVKVYNMIRTGRRKLGSSVTVLVLRSKKKASGGKHITDVFLIEDSIVGIPCNQTAWVHADSKSADPAGAYHTFSPLNMQDPASVERFHQEPSAWLGGGRLGKDNTEGQAMSETTKAAETATEQTAAGDVAQTAAAAETARKQIEGGLFKGLFQDEVDARLNSVSFLMDRLVYALYEWKNREADEAALDELLGEFHAAMRLAMTRDENAEPYMVFYSLNRAAFEQVSKAGARNSQSDQSLLHRMHDTLIDLGVPCERIEGGEGDAAAKSASVTALAEATSKAAELQAEVQQLRASHAGLEASLETAVKAAEALNQRLEEEKATSLAAVTALERYAREPLPRAGVSVS